MTKTTVQASATGPTAADTFDAISRTVWILTTLEAAVDNGVDLMDTTDGQNGLSILLGQARGYACDVRDALDHNWPARERACEPVSLAAE